MDEPTAGLDPGERVRFRNFISEFSHDRIVLISTHIVSDIEYIATRNAIMKAGKIVDVGTTDELVKEIEGKVWKGRENNMRIFRLEVKRIIMSRRTLVLIAAAILMSVIAAYLPISFESINRPGENGEVIELDGLSAIKFKRDYYAKTAGDVTPEKLAEALRIYQSCVKEYGTLDDVPLDVDIENIMAISLSALRFSFSAYWGNEFLDTKNVTNCTAIVAKAEIHVLARPCYNADK